MVEQIDANRTRRQRRRKIKRKGNKELTKIVMMMMKVESSGWKTQTSRNSDQHEEDQSIDETQSQTMQWHPRMDSAMKMITIFSHHSPLVAIWKDENDDHDPEKWLLLSLTGVIKDTPHSMTQETAESLETT
jgi:hypothetical protein